MKICRQSPIVGLSNAYIWNTDLPLRYSLPRNPSTSAPQLNLREKDASFCFFRIWLGAAALQLVTSVSRETKTNQ